MSRRIIAWTEGAEVIGEGVGRPGKVKETRPF
jgi:hypothetical protein